MGKYYAIGDIHGRLDMLESALRDWNPDNEQLILMGDYVDYGPYSKSTLREIHELTKHYGAIALKGNHDYVLSELLNNPVEQMKEWGHWLGSGRKETFQAFFGKDIENMTPAETAARFKKEHPQALQSLMDFPLYHETPTFLFVHAGVDLIETDWRNTFKEDFMMVRDSFWSGVNKTGKVIVFGHSRSGIIRGLKEGRSQSELYSSPFLDDRVWKSPCETKLGIDGGNVFGGLLHGVHLDDKKEEISIYTINQNNDSSRSFLMLEGVHHSIQVAEM